MKVVIVAADGVAAGKVTAVVVAGVRGKRLGGKEAVLTTSGGGLVPQGLHEMALCASGSQGT